MTMNERIRKIAKDRCGSVSALARAIGKSQANLDQYINGRVKIPLALVEDILEAFPEVSAEWLIRGKGAMIISDQEPQKQPEVQNGDGIVVKNVGKATNIGGGGMNEILEAFYKHNSEQTKAMRQEIEDLHQIINNLINKMQK